MSGGGGKKIATPKDPDPVATPIPGREESEAKRKTRASAQQRRGRASTILAGKLTSQQGNILNTRLG